jgi:hypothetical protein
MKTILTFFLFLILRCSVSAAEPSSYPELSVTHRVRAADFIAIVSVSNITATLYTNTSWGGRLVGIAGQATVHHTLKGTLPDKLQLKDENKGPVISKEYVGGSMFLVVLKRSGEFYVSSDSYGFPPVLGSGAPIGSAITWPACMSLKDAEAMIQSAIKKERP